MNWRQNAVRSLAVLAVGLTLGLLLSAGLRAPHRRGAAVPPDGSGTPIGNEPPSGKIWTSIQQLEAEQQELKVQLGNLRRDLASQQNAAAADTIQLQELEAELHRQRLIAGLVPVYGPGVVVTLDDSVSQVPADADPNLYLIHDYDLRDLVNLLWMAGSEAIAINGKRLVNNSSIYCVGSTVMVNNTRLSPPYLVRAIGNAQRQQEYLRNPSYLKGLWDKQRQYGVHIEIESAQGLSLPAFDGAFRIRYARPGE